MMGRFFDDVEKAYMKQFDNQDIIDFHHIDKIEEYHALLHKAMKRGTAVTTDEIIAYFGKEAYDDWVAYLKSWDE